MRIHKVKPSEIFNFNATGVLFIPNFTAIPCYPHFIPYLSVVDCIHVTLKLQLYKVAVTERSICTVSIGKKLQVFTKTDVTYEWKMYRLEFYSIMFAMNWEMKYCPYITTKSKFTIKHQLQATTLTSHKLMTITKNKACKEVTDFFSKLFSHVLHFFHRSSHILKGIAPIFVLFKGVKVKCAPFQQVMSVVQTVYRVHDTVFNPY